MPPQYGQPAYGQPPVYGQPPQNPSAYPSIAPPAQVYVAVPVGAQVMAPGQMPVYAPAPVGPKQDDQCCGCIEIRTGMKILFVLAILQACWNVFLCIEALMGKFPNSLLLWFLVQVSCQAIAAFCFYLGVKEDTLKSRYFLMRACRIELVIAVCQTFAVFTFENRGGSTHQADIASAIFSTALCVYWYHVSLRYLKQIVPATR